MPKKPAKTPMKASPGRRPEGKSDWEQASYRLPPGLRDEVKKAFHRVASRSTSRFSMTVEMKEAPASINEFLAAVLRSLVDSI